LKGVLDAYLADNVNARELKPDGTYVRVKSPDTEKKRDAQLEFAGAQADFN
jgi:polyphosphate kinase